MVILRYIIKSIFEKKVEAFLLILSVVAASTLVFTSLQVSESMRKLNTESASVEIGNSDIIIEPKDDPNALMAVDPDLLSAHSQSFEYVLAPFRCHVLYEPTVEDQEYFSVWGVSLKEIPKFAELSFTGTKPEDLAEDEVIISAHAAERLGFSEGDSIELNVHAHPGTYRIAGLATSSGIFASEMYVPVMIMNKDRLDEIFETGGIPNMLYLKLVQPSEKAEMIETLTALYPDADVTASEDSSLAGNSGSDPTISFLIVSLFAIMVSAFIIYTSYRVIMSERLSIIGTFRSVGATGRRMAGIYILESAVIGLLGGVLGFFLGIPASAQVLKLNAAERINESNAIPEINPAFVISTILFAVLLTVLASASPIMRSSRRSLRETLLGEGRTDREAKPFPALIGIILVIGGVIVSRLLPGDFLFAVVGSSVTMTVILIGLILMIPFLLRVTGSLLSRLGISARRNTLGLAAGNIRGNRSLCNNTILTGIGTASLIFIFLLNTSLSGSLDDMFKNDLTFDLYLVYNNASDTTIAEIGREAGIETVSPIYSTTSVPVKGSDNKINNLYGIDAETYFKNMNFKFTGDREEAVRRMNEENGILLSTRAASLLGIKEGDVLTLENENQSKAFTVAGIFETMWDGGHLGLISKENYSVLMKPLGYDTLLIKTTDSAAAVQNRLKNIYLTNIRYVSTHEEVNKRSVDGVASVFTVLKTFTEVALIISVVGIANNLILSFIERKRTFAIYRSIGADKHSIGCILATESALCSVVALVVGWLGAALLLSIVPNIIAVIVGPIQISYDPLTFLIFGASASFLMILSALIPAAKANSENLLESIRID